MITIDVAVITYNQAPYVEQALIGIKAQELDNDTKLRIIIADDCSTDGTLDKIKEFERLSKQSYIYLESDNRLGMVGNYRRVIDSIQSPYCCLLEGDDYWTDPYKLQKQIDYMLSHPECGLCYTDCSIINEQSHNMVVKALFEETGHPLDERNPLFEERYQANVTWMLNKEVFNYVSIPEDCMDIPLLFMYEAKLNFQIGFLPVVSAVFRLREGSVSSSKIVDITDLRRRYRWEKNVFKQCLRYAPKFIEPEQYFKKIYSDGLSTMYPLAYLQSDEEILSLYEKYLGDRINMSSLNKLIEEIQISKTRYDQIRSSRAYRLGKFLLTPFRWMKNLCKHKIVQNKEK